MLKNRWTTASGTILAVMLSWGILGRVMARFPMVGTTFIGMLMLAAMIIGMVQLFRFGKTKDDRILAIMVAISLVASGVRVIIDIPGLYFIGTVLTWLTGLALIYRFLIYKEKTN